MKTFLLFHPFVFLISSVVIGSLFILFKNWRNCKKSSQRLTVGFFRIITGIGCVILELWMIPSLAYLLLHFGKLSFSLVSSFIVIDILWNVLLLFGTAKVIHQN